MKLIATIIKTWKENIRDWKILVLVFAFSPFFLLITSLLYANETTIYKVGYINQDKGRSSTELLSQITNSIGVEDMYRIELVRISDESDLEKKIKEKDIDLGIVIPDNYSKAMLNAKSKSGDLTKVKFYGSIYNMHYTVAAVMISDLIEKQGIDVSQIKLPYSISESFLEKKLPSNEFDSYVPGLITLSVLMILFPASASIVKESDKKTLIRLKLSRLSAFEYLVGICIVQASIAIIAIVIAYFTALVLGYRPVGNFQTMLLIGTVSSLSMVSVSLVVASFLNTIFDVLTIGCFPFFLFMFFSGSMFPMPQMKLFQISHYSFGITDLLSLTHTANAFNKILNYGASYEEVSFEIVMIIVLTMIYFTMGLILYNKRKLTKA